MFDPSIASYFINPVHVALSGKTVSLINPATLEHVGVYGAPETYVIDAEGIVRYRHVGVVNEKVWKQDIKPIVDRFREKI